MDFDIKTLNKIRKEKRISYDELAKMTGYSRSTITNIFCGYVKFPRHETMQEIYNALGLQSVTPPARSLMELRINAGLTKEQMAQKLGVKELYEYDFMEEGIRHISNEKMLLICDIFGVTLDYLLGRPVEEIEEIAEEPLEDEKKDILRELWYIDFILSTATTADRIKFYKNLSEYQKGLFVLDLLCTKEDLVERKEYLTTKYFSVDALEIYQSDPSLWEKPETFDESRKIAHDGGKVAGNARRDIEKRLGQSVISPLSAKDVDLLTTTKQEKIKDTDDE